MLTDVFLKVQLHNYMTMTIIMDYKTHNLHFRATSLAKNKQGVSGGIAYILGGGSMD